MQHAALHGSTSNSAATSSHSSPPASKSDPETPASGLRTASEKNQPDNFVSSQNNHATDSRVQAVGTKIRSKPSSDDHAASTANDQPRELSVSGERNVNDIASLIDNGEKDRNRAKFLLENYERVAENSDVQSEFTVAAVAAHLYKDLIDWAVMDVAVQFKRNVFLNAEATRQQAIITAARGNDATRLAAPKTTPRLLYSEKNVTVECSNCGSNISASRYAQHVEKCLGRGGRMSSRAASARLRASAERAEKEAAADLDEHPVRRRRHSSVDPSGDGHSFGGGGYSKRRKMSPVPSAGSAAASQAGALQPGRGLPPSGRTRASPQ